MSLFKMRVTPAKTAWDWSEFEPGSWDGAFKETPEECLAVVKKFFLATKVKRKEFPDGLGYVVLSPSDTLITIKPSKKYKATIIQVKVSKDGKKLFALARKAFINNGVMLTKPQEFNGWFTCRSENAVTQAKWNSTVRPLFNDGWKALMVHGIQQVKMGPVTINRVDDAEQKVSIIYFATP